MPSGSRASRRAKLCSIPVDKGSAAGSRNTGELGGSQPAREFQGASGFPPVSATIRSSTDSSSRAARADSNSTLASRRPNGSTRAREAGQSTAHVTRRECERDPLRQQAASHERGARADPPSSCRVVDHARQRLLLGSFGEEAENREPDKERTRRLSGAESEGDAERVTLKIGETLGELEDRRQSCCSAA